METKQRNSNIELLRIMSMIGVIILHYNNPGIGGGLSQVSDSLNHFILFVLESISICAVNLFILISGYFLCRSSKRQLIKPIELIIQVIFFSVVLYIVKICVGAETLTIKGLIMTLVPSNWFVILYSTLYIISPYINILLEQLSGKQKKKMVIVLFAIFSVWPTIVDLSGEILGKEWIGLSSVGMYGSEWGYSIVNFLLVYIIGAYLYHMEESQNKRNKKQLLFCLLMTVLIITGWAFLNERATLFTERSAWEYCNPLVIIEAVIIFLLLKNMKPFYSKIVNNLAKGCFTVFLLQNTFIRKLHIDKYINGNVLLLLFHLLLNCVVIYIICWIIYIIYTVITKPFFKMLEKKLL